MIGGAAATVARAREEEERKYRTGEGEVRGRRSYPFPSSYQLGHEDGGSGDVGLGLPLVAPCRGEADTIIENKCS